MKNKIFMGMLLGVIAINGVMSANAVRRTSGNNVTRMSSQKTRYIGVNKARSIALSRVPGANSSHVRNLHFDYEDGRPVYEGKIYFKGLEYEFDIDAVTGRVVSWDVDRD